MPESTQARLRLLPEGAWIAGWNGGYQDRVLQFKLDSTARLPFGAPLEIETEEMLYFGELKQQEDSMLLIHVQHEVNQQRAAWLRTVWAEHESR